jgi:NADH:ubiquinone reductase (H+-translocating)
VLRSLVAVANLPKVVIVGGGFGGLSCAQKLARSAVQITLVDRANHHLFQPLLYQVATAGLSPGDIASPIRGVLARHSNVAVRLSDVQRVDLGARHLIVREREAHGWGPEEELGYDYLVLAPGVRHSYFGKPGWERFAPGLKTVDDALEIRRRVLLAFERAETVDDPIERDRLLTFVVVGAGPTGVELAGAIAELARYTVAGDFRTIDPTAAKVLLIEAGPRVLSAFDPFLSDKAVKSLQRIGVDVRLFEKVLDIDDGGVTLAGGRVRAATVMWAAGVEAPALLKTLGTPVDRSGRATVNADCSLPGFPDAFVIGDAASCAGADGKPLPGLAPVAIQQGRAVADNIVATIDRRPREPFSYFDKGIMATVGRASGLAQARGLKLWGFLGWLAWLFIHLLFIVEFRNRALVLLQWMWGYFTFQRGARLITGEAWQPPAEAAAAPLAAPGPERERAAVK